MRDLLLRVFVLALLVLDFVQTRMIVADGREINTLIGRHGENVPPAVYFGALALVVAFTPLRGAATRCVLVALVVVQCFTVSGNYADGYDFRDHGPRVALMS